MRPDEPPSSTDCFIFFIQETLKKFLLDLSQQKDHELRLLSSRIDYNGYYKRADARLNDSMKFSRCSELMMLS